MKSKSPSCRIPFVKFDVFARRPLEGNQLAVFPDARSFSTQQMQALAREMRLPETTFILPATAAVEKKNGVKVRIFTVDEELPFAGHPTLGTAFLLHKLRRSAEITLSLRVGPIPVQFKNRNGSIFGEMRQRDPEFGAIYSHREVAAALGLGSDDLDSELPVQTVNTGVPFCIVPIKRLATLRTLQLSWPAIAKFVADKPAKFLYFVCRETENSEATLHARMIFYGGEDPATGSAGGCATAWMVKHGVLASGEQGMIEQGIEISRPSQIFVRAEKINSKVTNVRVGGHVVEVMRGEVLL